VDVACLLSDGVHEDEVHQFYHRRLFRRILQEGQVHVLLGLHHIDVHLFLEHAQHVFDVLIGPVMLTDDFLDGRLRGHVDLDVLAGEEANVVDDEKVSRVGHGHVQGVAHDAEGDRLVFLSHVHGNQADEGLGDRQFGQVYLRDMELARQKPHQGVFADHPQFDEHGPDALPALGVFFQGSSQLVVVEQPLGNQQFADLFGHECLTFSERHRLLGYSGFPGIGPSPKGSPIIASWVLMRHEIFEPNGRSKGLTGPNSWLLFAAIFLKNGTKYQIRRCLS